MPTFEIVSAEGAGKSFRLTSDDFTIGRTPPSAIVLNHEGIAAPHVRITREGDRYVLTELDTAGGVYVNGHRVKCIPLCKGDKIRIGEVVLRYSPAIEPEPPPPPTLPRAATREVKCQQCGAMVQVPVSGDEVRCAGCGQKIRVRVPAPGPRAAKPPLSRRRGRDLLPKVVCPNCWFGFPPEDVVFISKHPSLLGDPVAGEAEYTRFVPDRFTVDWEARDKRGVPTTAIACPHCHLSLPEAAVEVRPMFISIVGSPASGKSYFLTATTWELRRLLPLRFALRFQDADLVTNSVIRDNENRLFRNPRPDIPIEISKTQQDDPLLHKRVVINGVEVRYPVPFQFLLWPTAEHPRFKDAHQLGRIVVLYDNAGEDFLPKAEVMESEAIHHLAESEIIFVLFDPIQEPAFRQYCRGDDPQLSDGLRPGTGAAPVQFNQELVINQVGASIHSYLKLPQKKRIKKPIIVIVPKFDVWSKLAGVSIDKEPFLESGEGTSNRLNLPLIERTSDSLRELFRQLCPNVVAAVESISEIVRYIPITSLGGSPSVVQRPDGHPFYGVRPATVRPKWVTVPFLYCLAQWGSKGILGSANGTR
jgi:DNA-directed RNA polymerase subunit RPC12/RpoP